MWGPQARRAGSGEMLWEYRGGGRQWGKACERVDIWAGCKRQGRTILRTAMPNTVLGALLALIDMQCSQQPCEKEIVIMPILQMRKQRLLEG